MTNFKKGDKAFFIQDFNSRGGVRVLEVTIKSIGKKQATVLVGEEMLKQFIYDFDYKNIFASKEEAIVAANTLGKKVYDQFVTIQSENMKNAALKEHKDHYQALIDQANLKGVYIEF